VTHSPGSDQTFPLTPMAQGLTLAQTLAARLCHDMAGIVGTLSGTLELAEHDAANAPESLAVARDAAAALQARLILLRAAFGASEQKLGGAELRDLLRGHPLGRRVALRLERMVPDRLWPGPAARLLLCLAMLGVESLAGEGEVAMQEESDGTVLLVLSGPRAIWPAGFASHVTDPATALEHAADQGPRGVLGPLVALLAQSAGARIRLLIGPHPETAPPLLISWD
jgi:histidine phosphotransferase ChpT